MTSALDFSQKGLHFMVRSKTIVWNGPMGVFEMAASDSRDEAESQVLQSHRMRGLRGGHQRPSPGASHSSSGIAPKKGMGWPRLSFALWPVMMDKIVEVTKSGAVTVGALEIVEGSANVDLRCGAVLDKAPMLMHPLRFCSGHRRW